MAAGWWQRVGPFLFFFRNVYFRQGYDADPAQLLFGVAVNQKPQRKTENEHSDGCDDDPEVLSEVVAHGRS